jgi:hypothetical protein
VHDATQYDPGVVQFVVGLIVGGSIVALLFIVIAPSRRVRAEKPLDRDVETQLLLGEVPETTIPPEPVPDHPRNYSENDLAELRRLGQSSRRKR